LLCSFQVFCLGGFLWCRCPFLNAYVHKHAIACFNHYDGNVIDVLALLLAVNISASNDHFKQCALMLFSIWERYPLSLWVLIISQQRHAYATDWARNWQAG